jgi:uncharacterized repeat protein (TIGR03803 family)
MKALGRLAIATVLGMLLLAPRGSAQTRTGTFATLYSFQENNGQDGVQPYAGLVAGKDAVLYGTTPFGGTSGAGTVFKLTPPGAAGGAWEERILYNFVGGEHDGANPYGGLVLDANGDLYGTTAAGGPVNAGTVFKLRRPAQPPALWRETILHDFGAIGDGATPKAGLTVGANGEMYGTTYYGGAPEPPPDCPGGCGTVFELIPSKGAGWTETVLYSFPGGGSDHANPAAGVVIGPGGVLYGTTVNGGTDAGTVFALKPPEAAGGEWAEATLHTFGDGDGAFPYGDLVIDKNGALYGTTSDGAGTVFKLEPPAWTESFYALTNGDSPYGGLVIGANGALYGTTYTGGTREPICATTGCGTVFQVNPPTAPGGAWTETVLHDFTGANGDGAEPYAGLVLGANGTLYGTTAGGGATGWGTVFAVTP